ncbi:MAG TPA: ABC transporter permease [Streptosporangiaceae bacterium]|nr:ABC transporter permease [Streptosporangiaceae bacterium]
MNDAIAGAVLQLRLFRRALGNLLLFVVIPFFSAIFLSAASNRGSSYLTARPVLAPAIIGLWMVSVVVAETVVTTERVYGTLPLMVAAPAAFGRVVAGRVLTVTLLGLLTVVEAVGVARIGFGAPIHFYHPAVFVLALLATALATAGTATALTAAFLAFRPAGRYVNTLGYPFYILAGVIVPVSFLPSWLRPVGDIIYLRWSAELLYASMSRASVSDPLGGLALILLLGGASYAIGAWLIRAVIDRLRATGEAGLI